MKAIEFNKRIKAILSKYEYTLIDGVYYFKNNTFGDFKLSFEKTKELGCVYFKFTSDKFNLELFYKLFNSNASINRFSFKWNIINGDFEYVLNEIEERLENLNFLNDKKNVELVLEN